MTKPIHLKAAEVRRLERNLSGKKGKRREDPDATIRRLRAELNELKQAAQGLVEYRRRVGPLNFQLEKADDYIRMMENILDRDGPGAEGTDQIGMSGETIADQTTKGDSI